MKTISVPGQCRCGRLRFVLREEPIAFYLCHCTRCQAESGSAFGQSMIVRREAIDAVAGKELHHTVEHEGGPPGHATHCGNCLTFMWGYSEQIPQLRGLNAGSLHASAGLEPHGNIWTRSARSWASFAPGPRFEQGPEDPLAMVRAWLERPRG